MQWRHRPSKGQKEAAESESGSRGVCQTSVLLQVSVDSLYKLSYFLKKLSPESPLLALETFD